MSFLLSERTSGASPVIFFACFGLVLSGLISFGLFWVLNNFNWDAGVSWSLVKDWSIGNGRLWVTEIELGLLWPQTLGGSTATNFGSNFLEQTRLMRSLVSTMPRF